MANARSLFASPWFCGRRTSNSTAVRALIGGMPTLQSCATCALIFDRGHLVENCRSTQGRVASNEFLVPATQKSSGSSVKAWITTCVFICDRGPLCRSTASAHCLRRIVVKTQRKKCSAQTQRRERVWLSAPAGNSKSDSTWIHKPPR